MAQYVAISPLLPTKIVHQFPIPTWIENLAIRSNGQILCTFITAPELWLVDPQDSSKTRLIHQFAETVGLSGIVEVEDDVFYITGGKFNAQTFQTEAGSFKPWRVDLRNFDNGDAGISVAIDLKDMRLPNGLCLLSKSGKTVLAADSEVGAIFKLDIAAGQHEIVIDAPETKNPDQAPMPIAANGVKIFDGYVYWSCTSKALFARKKIGETGEVQGDIEVLEQGFVCDDFCFDTNGNAWFTQNPLNTVGFRKAGGGIKVVAGSIDQMTVAGCTACHFDRKLSNEHILYVVTTGGLGGPVNGTQVEGGMVIAVDTSAFNA